MAIKKNIPLSELDRIKSNLLFKRLSNVDELVDWVYLFFDIKLPKGHVYPTSNSSPAEAAWEIYNLYKTGESRNIPVITMLASRDSYKCQSENSKILTKNGLKNIQDISIGDIVWSGWNWRKTTDHIDDGIKKSINFKLSNGLNLSGSPIHRYWCMRDGKIDWIKSEDIIKSDLFCINTNTSLDRNLLNSNQNEFDLGYLLGCLIGDGSISSIDNGMIVFTNSDEKVIEKYIRCCEKFLGVKPDKKEEKEIWIKSEGIFRLSKATQWTIYSKEVAKKLKELGITQSKAHDKSIPSYCYSSNSAMIGFISGLFDSDGTYNSRNQVEFPITALKVLTELQKVFISYGINARLYSNKRLYSYEKSGVCRQNHIVHKLYITANEYPKFEELKLQLLAKKAGKIKKAQIYDAHDTIPLNHVQDFLAHCKSIDLRFRGRKYKKPKVHTRRNKKERDYRGISTGKLRELLLWHKENIELGIEGDSIFVPKIEFILNNAWFPYTNKEISNSHFYDLTVEEDHAYWSNGCISHNTLTAAVIEVLCFLHFAIPCTHGAALKMQSEKSLEYINTFFRKVEPYLSANGWRKTSESKSRIEFVTDKNETVYIVVVAATKQAMNSQHTPLLCLDELDLMKTDAWAESSMIPSTYKEFFPLTLNLSTRKFAGGLMEKVIQATEKVGKVLRWNIIDITEKLDESVIQRDKPKIRRYVSIKPPLINISEEEYNLIPEDKRSHLEAFDAYAGIAEHPLLSVFRHYTADRPEQDKGNLYKHTIAVLNNFRATAPEMADAQLLCNKPSGTNLVFPRFSEAENVISLEDAFVKLGRPADANKSYDMLRWLIKDLGVMTIGGCDYAWTDATSFVVLGIFPSGDVWLLDSFCKFNMEIPDMIAKAKEMDTLWDTQRWYIDQADPSKLVEFRKAGLKVPVFKKVVSDGLSAMSMKILDGNNNRKFQVLDIPQNRPVIDAFGVYKWDTDASGDIVDGQPFHGKDGTSDIMDSIRYPMQNLFGKGGQAPIMETTAITYKTREKTASEINSELVYGQFKQYISPPTEDSTKKKKRIMF